MAAVGEQFAEVDMQEPLTPRMTNVFRALREIDWEVPGMMLSELLVVLTIFPDVFTVRPLRLITPAAPAVPVPVLAPPAPEVNVIPPPAPPELFPADPAPPAPAVMVTPPPAPPTVVFPPIPVAAPPAPATMLGELPVPPVPAVVMVVAPPAVPVTDNCAPAFVPLLPEDAGAVPASVIKLVAGNVQVKLAAGDVMRSAV